MSSWFVAKHMLPLMKINISKRKKGKFVELKKKKNLTNLSTERLALVIITKILRVFFLNGRRMD